MSPSPLVEISAASAATRSDMAFLTRARDGDLDWIKAAIASGARPSNSDAMIAAVKEGRFDCALALLPLCDPHAVDKGRQSVLNLALYFSEDEGSLPFIQALINAGVNPAALDQDGMDSLQWAIFSERVEALSFILPYCDPTLQSQSPKRLGYNALMIASMERLPDHVELLAPRSNLEQINCFGLRADEMNIDPAIRARIVACRIARNDRVELDASVHPPAAPARSKPSSL